MSGSIKTRSRTKGNETTRGDASAAPDDPGISGIREERGHEARALSNNTTTTQMLASSLTHRSIEWGQNQSGSALSERPGSRCMTSNEARTMQTTASSTFDNYGAGNGPNTSESSSHHVGIGNPCCGLRLAISNIDAWSIISATTYSRSIGEIIYSLLLSPPTRV